MLTDTLVHRGRACGSQRLRKNGCNRRGAQRAQCLECRKTLVLVPASRAYPAEERARVRRAYQERMSTRAIKRTFGVCYQTLMRWVGEKSRGPARPGGHAAGEPKGRRAGVGRNVGLRAAQS